MLYDTRSKVNIHRDRNGDREGKGEREDVRRAYTHTKSECAFDREKWSRNECVCVCVCGVQRNEMRSVMYGAIKKAHVCATPHSHTHACATRYVDWKRRHAHDIKMPEYHTAVTEMHCVVGPTMNGYCKHAFFSLFPPPPPLPKTAATMSDDKAVGVIFQRAFEATEGTTTIIYRAFPQFCPLMDWSVYRFSFRFSLICLRFFTCANGNTNDKTRKLNTFFFCFFFCLSLVCGLKCECARARSNTNWKVYFKWFSAVTENTFLFC